MSTATELEIQAEAFDQGTKVAQIFSGIFFGGLATWLTVTNGTKLAFVRQASLEKRLTVCCFLNTYVGFLSAFLNFFQLTQVDDAVLPHQDQFVLDLSRPVEWVLTCPLMQLILVLMGGPKIPEYRMYLMPLFSVVILSMGTTSMFMPTVPTKLVFYIAGVCTFSAMAYFNRLQIIEYSGGSEGLLGGDSEFRKATLLLLVTWAPFPCWFMLSPEGFGIIDNVLLIQVGWAFLNIVAKFVFAFYIQRIKDLYCNRLKTKRELAHHGPTGPQASRAMAGRAPLRLSGTMSPNLGGDEFQGPFSPDHDKVQAYENAELARKKGQLSAVVIETLSYLGMAQHTDRFMKLLERANISTIVEVEALTTEQAAVLQLPWDLVSALQRRLRVWKLEMVDDAEMGLEKGEEHYFRKAADDGEHEGMIFQGQEYAQGVSATEVKEIVEESEQRILEAQKNNAQVWESALRTFADHLQAELQTMATQMNQRMESQMNTGPVMPTPVMTTKGSKETVGAVDFSGVQLRDLYSKVDQCCQKVDDLAQSHEEQGLRLSAAIRDSPAMAVAKINTSIVEALSANQTKATEQWEENSTQVRQGFDLVIQKVDSLGKTSAKGFLDGETAWRRRLDDMENAMTCRDTEFDAALKVRHEEFIRSVSQNLPRKFDELANQVQAFRERNETCFDSLSANIQSENQVASNRLMSKVEQLQTFMSKQNADADTHMQQTLESTINMSVAQAVQKGGTDSARRLEKNMEMLDQSMQKQMSISLEKIMTQMTQQSERAASRHDKALEEATTKAVSEAQLNGTSQFARATEKALQDFENSHRGELQHTMNTVVEKIEDIQASHQRRQAEREERNNRRVEEMLDTATNRSLQKVEDVGLDLKKEVHGFAKRLNNKLHFL